MDFLHNNFHHGYRAVEGSIAGTDGEHATTLTSTIFTIGANYGDIDGAVGWEEYSTSLPVGGSIVVEFRFTCDTYNSSQADWHLDDVAVTAQP